MSLSLFTKLITTSRGIKASGYNKEYNVDKIENDIYVKSDYEQNIVQPIVKNVFKMDRSTYHTLYILSNKSVYASGDNSFGQIPFASSSESEVFLRDITDNIKKLTSKGYDIKEVVCGGYHTFLMLENNDIYACGLNCYGQLGINITSDIVRTMTKVNTPEYIEKIYTGGYHTFFIGSSGKIYACGKNDWGQLGLGTITDTQELTVVPNISDVQYIRCGESHTFFVLSDGTIQGCGQNYYSELGCGEKLQLTK